MSDDDVLVCDICGEITDGLRECDDNDESVGYHGTVLVCESCIEKRFSRRYE